MTHIRFLQVERGGKDREGYPGRRHGMTNAQKPASTQCTQLKGVRGRAAGEGKEVGGARS